MSVVHVSARFNSWIMYILGSVLTPLVSFSPVICCAHVTSQIGKGLECYNKYRVLFIFMHHSLQLPMWPGRIVSWQGIWVTALFKVNRSWPCWHFWLFGSTLLSFLTQFLSVALHPILLCTLFGLSTSFAACLQCGTATSSSCHFGHHKRSFVGLANAPQGLLHSINWEPYACSLHGSRIESPSEYCLIRHPSCLVSLFLVPKMTKGIIY